MKKSILWLALMLAAAGSASAQTVEQLVSRTGFQPVKDSPVPPAFELPGLDGVKQSLSGYKGKLVVLNFWATWCPPCRAEMPSMQKLYGELKSGGFEILAVNLQENAKTVGDFVKKFGYTFPVVLDAAGAVGGSYGVRAIPTSFLIDRQGRVIGSLIGAKEWTDRAGIDALKALLAK